MKPTEKHPAISEFINSSFGVKREESIVANLCISPPIGCGKPITEFRDQLSEQEYRISGLCQKCQDQIFGA